MEETISAALPSALVPTAAQNVVVGHDTPDRSPALFGVLGVVQVTPPSAVAMIVAVSSSTSVPTPTYDEENAPWWSTGTDGSASSWAATSTSASWPALTSWWADPHDQRADSTSSVASNISAVTAASTDKRKPAVLR